MTRWVFRSFTKLWASICTLERLSDLHQLFSWLHLHLVKIVIFRVVKGRIWVKSIFCKSWSSGGAGVTLPPTFFTFIPRPEFSSLFLSPILCTPWSVFQDGMVGAGSPMFFFNFFSTRSSQSSCPTIWDFSPLFGLSPVCRPGPKHLLRPGIPQRRFSSPHQPVLLIQFQVLFNFVFTILFNVRSHYFFSIGLHVSILGFDEIYHHFWE